MSDQFVLTPYFLDRKLPGLLPLAGEDWRIVESSLSGEDSQQRMLQLYEPLASAVEAICRAGDRPVSIAGDCCAPIGVLAGLQRAGIDPTLVWLDAHGDFNTWETSPSGFIIGMPLAMIVGRGEQTLPEGLGLTSLAETRVVLSDARDLDPKEALALQASAVRHLTSVTAIENAHIPAGPVYLHFDTDILDPSDAPAMNFPTPGGPSTAELEALFARLADGGRVAAISVSTWNPTMEGAAGSQDLIMGLLDRLLV